MPTVATLLFVLSCFSLTTLAQTQTNVTVRDIDPRITFNPLCDPPNQLCHGGWYSYNFSAVDKRTMTFGPSVETRFVLPSATFEFNGTAIYYYGITSAKAASVSISIDGGTASLVNLTQMYNLNASSGIYFPVYAWSATNLDPNKEHTFYLEYAQSNPSGAGLWSGFDSLVFTPSTPTIAPTSTNTPTPSVSYKPSNNASTPGVNGKLIGGIFAGTLAILVVVFAFTYWCVRIRERRSKEALYAIPTESIWSLDQASTRPPTTARSSAVGVPGSRLSASQPTSSALPRSSLDSSARSVMTRITTAIATVITPYRASPLPPPTRAFSHGIPSAPPSPHSSAFSPLSPRNDPFRRLPRPLPPVPGGRSDTLSYTQGSITSSPPSHLTSNPFSNSASTYASSPLSRGPSLGASAILPEARPSRSRPNSVALLARQQQEIRELLDRQRREQEAAGMDMSVLADDVPMMPLSLSVRHSNGSLSASERSRPVSTGNSARSRPVSAGNSARSWPSDRKVDPDASPSSSDVPLATTATTTPSPRLPPIPSTPPLPSFALPLTAPAPVAASPFTFSNSPSSFRHTLASAFTFTRSPLGSTMETPSVHPRSNLARSNTVVTSSTWRTQATAPPAYSPN